MLTKNVISVNQLEDSLMIQMDNPNLKLGEILVSSEIIDKAILQETLKAYIKETGKKVEDVNDWVTQEEADIIIKELTEELG